MYRDRIIDIFFTVLRVGMGLFFLIVGGRKVVQIDQLQADIVRFDFLPSGWEWIVACLAVALELVVGFSFVFKKLYQGATILGIAMACVFVSLFVQGWIRGLSLSCNCLGFEKEVVSYPTEVGMRLLLLGLMLALFWDAFHRGKTLFKPKRLDFSEM
jgi:hypothetical protein